MRTLLITVTALVAPGIALAASQCSVPPRSPPAASLQPIQAASAEPMPIGGLAIISAGEIERVPALKRISSRGAQLIDLGSEHGLRGVFARQGDSFQVFYVAPDGQAVIGGVMWEASGRNVTRQQVTPIDGAIPTVTIGTASTEAAAAPPAQPQANTAPAVPPAKSLIEAAEHTTSGSIGDPKAPKMWVYIDPLCSFSVKALNDLKPYVASGRVQLAVIPLSVLDYEDQGRSTIAAKAMLSFPPADMVEAWSTNKLTGRADPAASGRLAANMTSAASIGLRGTPTFIWRGTDGKEGRADGLPGNLDALIAAVSAQVVP